MEKNQIIWHSLINKLASAVALSIFTVLIASSVTAQDGAQKYIGFWRSGVGDSKVLQFDSWEEFTDKCEEYGKKNLRLQDLEVVKTDSDIKYTGTWIPGKGKYALLSYDNFKDFSDKYKEMLDDKLMQLIDVEVVPIGGKNYYIGIWDVGTGGSAMYMYNNWEDFTTKWNDLAKENRVLIDVEAFQSESKVWYLGVWQNGTGKDQRLFNTDTFDKFEAKWKEFNKEDLRLIDVDIVRTSAGDKYIGVWNKGTGGQFLWIADSLANLQAKNKEMNASKLDLIDIAMVEYPVPKPKPTPKPQGKPAQSGILYFSKDQQVVKDPVSEYSFPADMPAIRYPEFDGCNAADKKTIQRAWARAHYSTWRAVQMFKFLDASGDKRDDLRSSGYVSGPYQRVRRESWSPYAWFGEYNGGSYRYEFIRDAIYMSWDSRFNAKMTVKCRRDDGGAHPCYLKNPGTDHTPSANHIVNGTINFCNRFFDDKNDEQRIITIIHETYHWLAPRGLAILDTHSHWDRNSNGWCRSNVDKMYGDDNAIHLASSEGCWGNDKYHKSDAVRNNDNYAYFIYWLGRITFEQKMKQFPG